jgi:hypothetical protein
MNFILKWRLFVALGHGNITAIGTGVEHFMILQLIQYCPMNLSKSKRLAFHMQDNSSQNAGHL